MSTENKREMKLAEALLLRSDLLKKIEHIQNRIIPVLIVSDDKHPQEDPIKLQRSCVTPSKNQKPWSLELIKLVMKQRLKKKFHLWKRWQNETH